MTPGGARRWTVPGCCCPSTPPPRDCLAIRVADDPDGGGGIPLLCCVIPALLDVLWTLLPRSVNLLLSFAILYCGFRRRPKLQRNSEISKFPESTQLLLRSFFLLRVGDNERT